ncbi:Cysteine-rich RLK (RECEPTOR-like protein kinase) 42 [Heracleum sosnowskyi]|uniref:Cysteine-rich RLK (RECEPTOR-like protein kinase) 42 n=1 Tax=Heracleum sosnowskyi TaxID=360622 RepID=A0AAD8JG90_9APIA|nr:Cysteine-rich RLK (RECEPTOR-like protein kinase) 42 [Heracleum sosnowskyi]
MTILLHGVFLILMVIIGGVLSDPQARLLKQDCSQFPIEVEMSVFLNKFNKTFGDIRKQLSNNSNIHFATEVQTDVYGMVQCRNYLSSADCVACLDVAWTQIRQNCSTADGGHVIYEGCFLRYEAHNFFRQSLLVTFESTAGVCSTNQSKSEATDFTPVVEGLITDLVSVTPKIDGFFAATTRPVFNGGVTTTVYAVAQCIENISQKDCQSCLRTGYSNIKSCPPASGGSSVDAGCFIRYSDSSFFPDNSIIDITPYLQGAGNSSSKMTIIGGAVGGICLLLLIMSVLLWYQLMRKRKIARRGDIFGLTKLQGPVIYSFSDLKSATKSFSEDFKIGEGGFGDVYKGIIKNGDAVAVKKLSIATSKARTDFESEVRLISNVNHRNIIRLLGCGSRGSELLLVFEYMENGSLDTFLYGEKKGSLSWKQRVDIIIGIAKGLAYLHEQFHLRIIHRDIKSSNILLDDDYQPKIADFGLARLIGDDQSHLTTRFAGTLGYTAPEYAIHGHLSEKVDTYSFGIVVLEIVSGRRCSNLNIEPDTDSLLIHTWTLYESDMHSDLIDETLDPEEYNINNVKKIIEIALMCTQSPTSVRPAMSEVVVSLTNDSSIVQNHHRENLVYSSKLQNRTTGMSSV